jgi:cytochrome c553
MKEKIMNAYQRAIKAGLLVVLMASTAVAQAAGGAAAGDAAAGAEKAKGCASCHGIDGKGRIPLAGKDADYLAQQLHAFKSGVRKEQMMNMMAGSLSDQDIADLAAYFSSQ